MGWRVVGEVIPWWFVEPGDQVPAAVVTTGYVRAYGNLVALNTVTGQVRLNLGNGPLIKKRLTTREHTSGKSKTKKAIYGCWGC